MSVDTGDLGEALCLYRLLELGVKAAIVNIGVCDVIAFDNSTSVRIQVKSSNVRYRVRNDRPSDQKYYSFSLAKGGGNKEALTSEDCDVVALVALDIEKVLFMGINDFNPGSKKINLHPKYFYIGCELDSWRGLKC